MRVQFRYLAVAGVAAAILGAPVAAADDSACTDVGAATECSTPGNTEIDVSPFPLAGDDGFATGSYGGPYAVPFDEGGR